MLKSWEIILKENWQQLCTGYQFGLTYELNKNNSWAENYIDSQFSLSLYSTKSFSWSSYRIWILCMPLTTCKQLIMSLVSIHREIVLHTLSWNFSCLTFEVTSFLHEMFLFASFPFSRVSCWMLPAVSVVFFLILGCLFYCSVALKLLDLHPLSKLEVAFPFLVYWYPVTTDLIKCSSIRCWGSQLVANMTSTGVSAVP